MKNKKKLKYNNIKNAVILFNSANCDYGLCHKCKRDCINKKYLRIKNE